ncbi:MAG: TolC family protein, partial [Verrucomicrobia subdivision 3 bacterium]|nr:TolC family protein [Limisphaerales bacterium]
LSDVEFTQLDRRQIELERMNVVAAARINTLLRRPAQASLPPPPGQLSISPASLDLDVLQEVAVQRRPDIAALAARVRAEQAAVTVACKEYYPDGEFFGRYDSFWQPAETQSDLRGQVGVRLNVPIYKGRLNAAVREAMFRLSQRRAEYDQKVLDVRYEVQTAYAQLEESRKSLDLYSERLLPFAGQNVDAAQANYDVGKDSFLDLALAQRELIDVREKREEALVDYHRRLAELYRAVGGSVPAANAFEDVPEPTP